MQVRNMMKHLKYEVKTALYVHAKETYNMIASKLLQRFIASSSSRDTNPTTTVMLNILQSSKRKKNFSGLMSRDKHCLDVKRKWIYYKSA